MAGYCTLLTQTFNSTPFHDQKVALKCKVNMGVPQAFVLNCASASAKLPQYLARLNEFSLM